MKAEVSVSAGRAANARVLAHVNRLETVRLAELHCKAHKSAIGDTLTLLTQLHVRGELDGSDLSTYSLYRSCAVDDESDVSTPENTVWTVEVAFVAHWTLIDTADLTPQDAQCFAMGQGALTCHPYAREAIQNATSRMNFPPATIDLIYSPWHGDGDTIVQVNVPD